MKGALPEKCFRCQSFVNNFQGLLQLVPFYQVSVEISCAKIWSHIHPGGTSSTSCCHPVSLVLHFRHSPSVGMMPMLCSNRWIDKISKIKLWKQLIIKIFKIWQEIWRKVIFWARIPRLTRKGSIADGSQTIEWLLYLCFSESYVWLVSHHANNWLAEPLTSG